MSVWVSSMIKRSKNIAFLVVLVFFLFSIFSMTTFITFNNTMSYYTNNPSNLQQKYSSVSKSSNLLSDSVDLNVSSFLGGSINEAGSAITVDNAGNMYIAGYTNSPDFPTKNAYQTSLNNTVNSYHTNPDAFIAKFSASNQLLFSTYLGGNDWDGASGIAVDQVGNIYITGSTSSTNFPTKNAFQNNYAGGNTNNRNDAFIAKFDSSGNLIYSTYFGGSGDDEGFGIAVDTSGDCYITGTTNSTNFPILNNINQVAYTGSSTAFLAKFNASGNLLFSSYIGATYYGYGTAITIDDTGNIFITGSTNSPSFPIKNAFQSTLGGSGYGAIDAFISKYNSTGYLEFSSYFGGNNIDSGKDISIDNFGNIFITGSTTSSDLATKDAFSSTYNENSYGMPDAFIAKFNSSLGLVFSSYLGGTIDDYGTAITVDSVGNSYITGSTSSTDFPIKNAIDPNFVGNDFVNSYVTKFNSSGNLIYSTYFGGNGTNAYDIACDSSGMIYLTGGTISSNFPLKNAYDSTFGGGGMFPPIGDAFFAKFDQVPFIAQTTQSTVSSANTKISATGTPGFELSSIFTIVLLASIFINKRRSIRI